MRILPLLAPLLILLPGSATAADDLAAAVERAVDLPDPAARAKAADALAKRPGVTVDALLPVLRAFGRFRPKDPGIHHEVAALRDGRVEVPSEITVYVPPGYDPAKAAPLLMAFHGAGGRGEDMPGMWKGTADALGMIVVAPSDMGPNGGYEYSSEERALALSALRWARRTFHVDENRIHAAGVSRGGHLVWDLVLRHPDLFASAAPMIGGPRISNGKGENNLRFLENVVHLPIRDLQGSGDHPLLLASLRFAFDRLAGWRAEDAKLIEFPDLGHAFDFGAVDWTEFLGNARRDPGRDRVVRCTLDGAEGRAFWAEVQDVGRGAKTEIVLTVDPKAWEAMDEVEKREYHTRHAERLTARLFVHRKGPGVYAASGRHVDRFRLLLPEDAFTPGEPVVVSLNGRTTRVRPAADPRVLLRDFVERFDRTWLPVAAVEIH